MLCHNLIFHQIIHEINTLQLKHRATEKKKESREKCVELFCSIGELMIYMYTYSQTIPSEMHAMGDRHATQHTI